LPLNYHSPANARNDVAVATGFVGLAVGILAGVITVIGFFWPVQKVGPNHPGDFVDGWWALPLAVVANFILIPIALFLGIRSICQAPRRVKRMGWITVLLSIFPIVFLVLASLIMRARLGVR
jgi:hypothetical protein